MSDSVNTPSSSSSCSSSLPWSPSSWRSLPISQQPSYDSVELSSALHTLQQLPPLVHEAEIDALLSNLADAAAGRKFVLQGGDCAERFQDCTQQHIENKLRIILQMSLVLTARGRVPTVRIGRVAGQYGKPRSSPYETIDGHKVLSFKGDNINQYEISEQQRAEGEQTMNQVRRHDPARLVTGHFHSAATLNYIRALIKSGFADLHRSKNWDLSAILNHERRAKYEEISNSILEHLEFLELCSSTSADNNIREIDFWTSHEGLILEYEQSVTRVCDGNKGHYNSGAHLLWIGNRTRDITCAHVEYFRGIKNPIGIKVDADITPHDLIALIERLDPHKVPGRITLITRMGEKKITHYLPTLIKAVHDAGRKLTTVWSCDPMHGNTYTTSEGYKTRSFDAVVQELMLTYATHEANNSHLGGVHFELTGEDVTECVGGPTELSEHHLKVNYTSYCDPRLNYLQSMDISFMLAEQLRTRRKTLYPPTNHKST